MIAWLESLPSVAAGLVVVGGFVATTLVLGYLVSRFTSHDVRLLHNDRAGFILAVIGVIYAVLLAFIAIGIWERFQQAEARSYDEAGALATIYRDAQSFSQGARIRAAVRAYVRSVVDDEWPRMSRGEKSQTSEALLDAVDLDVRGITERSGAQQDVHAQMLEALDTAQRDRQTRLTTDFIGINAIMWVVLIAGAYVTVAFTYLFAFEHPVMQHLMIGGLSLMIGLVLFLVLAMDYPYRGGIAVGPEAFRALLDSLHP